MPSHHSRMRVHQLRMGCGERSGFCDPRGDEGTLVAPWWGMRSLTCTRSGLQRSSAVGCCSMDTVPTQRCRACGERRVVWGRPPPWPRFPSWPPTTPQPPWDGSSPLARSSCSRPQVGTGHPPQGSSPPADASGSQPARGREPKGWDETPKPTDPPSQPSALGSNSPALTQPGWGCAARSRRVHGPEILWLSNRTAARMASR